MSRTLMWEARAGAGRGADLLAWALEHAPSGADVYRGGDGRVVVIDPSGAGLPEPPADLLARAVHVWPFDLVRRGAEGTPS